MCSCPEIHQKLLPAKKGETLGHPTLQHWRLYSSSPQPYSFEEWDEYNGLQFNSFLIACSPTSSFQLSGEKGSTTLKCIDRVLERHESLHELIKEDDTNKTKTKSKNTASASFQGFKYFLMLKNVTGQG